MTVRGIDLVLASGLPWLLVICAPLLLALASVCRPWRPAVTNLTPWAALPALALALQTRSGAVVELPWLLLGTRLGLDDIGQVFLGFTALLWLSAGVYARRYLAHDDGAHRFFVYFLLTMTGNIGLILAHDMLSFFLFFAVMSFASYGLIVHNRDAESVRAGRVYIVLVVIGEVMLFAALLLIASHTGYLDFKSAVPEMAKMPTRGLFVSLVLVGFGIKVGALPLHVWLPLAHPAAPTPASAVLSGAMIKAGLLGWLRFLPLGQMTAGRWGAICMIGGLLAAFYGVVVGVGQRNPKTVLAYSSVSQMGLITVLVGISLTVPQTWPPVLAAILAYATHHALAKGALFLGVGVAAAAPSSNWQRRWIAAGLFLPALALAGAPLTSGALAKITLKTATSQLPFPWTDILGQGLTWAAVGTTLLMGRYLSLLWPRRGETVSPLPVGLWLPWVVLIAGLPVMGLLLPWGDFLQTLQKSVASKALKGALWPLGTGAVLLWGAGRLNRRRGRRRDRWIPVGDVLVPTVWLLGLLCRAYDAYVVIPFANSVSYLVAQCRHRYRAVLQRRPLLRLESHLGRWTVAGTLFLFLAVMLLALLMVPSLPYR